VITPRDWPDVRALFHEALQRPAAERLAFVRSAAASQDVLKEVESLLAAEQAADGFLSTPPVAVGDRASTPLLTEHTRLGHFEILGLVGAGGMGEVYRARDTRLDRTVAIKVLSRDLLLHAEARDRFEREARLISKFSHPHVCTLHDVGTASVAGTEIQFLVMELVAGESLAARLQRGPLPIADAMKAGGEILDALAAAHAAGVVHRDLKPGNVMLTRSGVKLLDFGVARLVQAAAPADRQSGIHDPLSKDGMVLGTMPYMSPEQLRGEAADARSDVFAFGAVLYEMVTGVRAFTADTDTALVAAILERDPTPISTLRPDAAAGLDRIVATCLAKSPEDRWPRARDVLRELTWLRDDAGHRVAAVPTSRPARAYRIAAVAAAALVAVTALVGGVLVRREPPPASRISFSITAPRGYTFPRATADMALSADGTRLAFAAYAANGTRQLWLRRFDDPEAHAIAGTDGAEMPFWAPEGRTLAFFTNGRLKRVNEDGTALATICEVGSPRGGAWSRSGVILFGSDTVLHQVPAAGGTPVHVTELDRTRHQRVHGWPRFLPDGRQFLFVNLNTEPAQSAIFQASLDAPGMQRVVAGATSFALVGTRLLWADGRTLVSQEYNAEQAEMIGQPREIVRGIGVDTRTGLAGFAAAPGGVLVYRAVGDQSRLTWYDRTGRALETFREPGDYQHPALSLDDRWLTVEKTDASTGRHTIWLLDIGRGVMSRLLVDPYGAHGPVWSPDGSTVMFVSNRIRGGQDAFTISADGSGDQRLALPDEGAWHRPSDWTAHPALILYDREVRGNSDIWVASAASPSDAKPFVATSAEETQARFSPDVRWIAYTSDESGTPEVYVRRYPDGGGARRLSTSGGAQPQWRRDGKEIFYLAADGKLMAADVTTSGTMIETGTPHGLFDTGVRGLLVERRNHYVVTSDGQRFLTNVTEQDDNAAPLTVVMNWER